MKSVSFTVFRGMKRLMVLLSGFGLSRFTYTLIFTRGRVTDIRTGGYGH